MAISNSQRVKDLKDRVIKIKENYPEISPMKVINRFPRLKVKYIQIKNVLAMTSTDETITKKMEIMVNESQSSKRTA